MDYLLVIELQHYLLYCLIKFKILLKNVVLHLHFQTWTNYNQKLIELLLLVLHQLGLGEVVHYLRLFLDGQADVRHHGVR